MTPSVTLRAATVITALCGITTLTTAHILAAPANVVTLLLVVCSAVMSARLTSPSEAIVRRRCAVVILTVASIAAVVSAHGAFATSTSRMLSLLLCTAAVTHSLVVDTVRDARVNTGISVSMLVLAAGLAPGLAIAVPLVATWVCAVTAFVLAARDAEGAAATQVAVVVGSVRDDGRLATAVAAAVAVTVLAGLAFALVLPHPSGLSAHTKFGQGTAADQPSGSSGQRQASAYLGDGPLSLDARGQLSDAPIAVVSTDRAELWAATVLTTYDGHSWSSPQGPGTLLPGTVSSAGSTVDVPSDTSSPATSTGATRTDIVGWVGPDPAVVIAPGTVTGIDLRTGGSIAQEADGRLVVDDGGPTPTYLVRSTALPRVEDGVSSTTGGDATSARWRALPPTVPNRVHQLAVQVTANATNRADAARDVETYLNTHETYDLDSPVAAPGADSVDDFLFRTHSGFCEQFASAEVVMLRSLGIPARFVSGFASGHSDGAGHRVLTAADAHAWVEVWLPGVGWATSDPTAGATLTAQRGHGLTALMQRIAREVGRSTTTKLALAVLLAALAALAVVVPGRRRRDPAARGALAPTAPLFAAFHRLELALAKTGRPRADAESVRALAARLEATDDVVGALRAVEEASYASTPPGRGETEAAVDTLDRLTARMLSRPEPPAPR